MNIQWIRGIMCNCPLTSPNKVLISVFSRSLWLEWSFNYWRTALEGSVPMGTRSNSELLLRVLSAWEPCHNFDFNYLNPDALKSVLDLENYVQVDKLWTNKMSVSSKCFRTFSNLLRSKKVFVWFCFVFVLRRPTGLCPKPWGSFVLVKSSSFLLSHCFHLMFRPYKSCWEDQKLQTSQIFLV